MSIEHASTLTPTAPTFAAKPASARCAARLGGTEFLTRAHRTQRCRELADAGYLVARVVPPFERDDIGGQAAFVRRGELRQAIEGAVEISLALRGALPPAVALGVPVELAARDQVSRMLRLGSRGLCVVLPDLRRLCISPSGALETLEASDSAALEAWRCMAVENPVTLLFDESDKDLVMLAPRRLDEVFKVTRRLPSSWPEDARSLLESTTAEPPAVAARDVELAWESTVPPDDEASDDVECGAGAADLADCVEDEADDEPEKGEVNLYEAPTRPGKRVMANDPLLGLNVDETAQPSEASRRSHAPQPSQAEVSLFEHVAALEGRPPAGRSGAAIPPPSSHMDEESRDSRAARPSLRLARETVQRFCRELEEAHGPRPVSVIEDLFKTRYTPLLEALSTGLADERVERVVEEWRASFEKSYGESFNTMRVTGKRPRMVLDVPEIAARLAKIHGARAVQLVMVDGMRYDLGQRVARELAQELDGRGQCVEEPLMWAALPTVTPVQLHLLARGPRGLREEPHSEREPVIHRAGSLTTLRRVRIGQRDLLKLDLAEARLREAGAGFETRMSALAEEIGDIIGHLAQSLPARTLLFVFGDHGFYLPIGGPDATGPAEQGNATPEEVLVGGQAWLLGAD